MGKLIMCLAIAAAASLANPAWADRDHAADHAPAAGQISTQTMKQKLDELGYDVKRLEPEDGYFEAHVVDRQSGGAVKAHFDLATGDLVRAELHDGREAR